MVVKGRRPQHRFHSELGTLGFFGDCEPPATVLYCLSCCRCFQCRRRLRWQINSEIPVTANTLDDVQVTTIQ